MKVVPLSSTVPKPVEYDAATAAAPASPPVAAVAMSTPPSAMLRSATV